MLEYRKILYLDSDVVAISNIDHLLDFDLHGEKIAVARDFASGKWLPTFNMGVFLCEPNLSEYEYLLMQQSNSSVHFDVQMSEQGFLNVLYRDRWADLGFINNANLAVFSQDRQYWDAHADQINIIHYTMSKPWECTDEYMQVCRIWQGLTKNSSKTINLRD